MSKYLLLIVDVQSGINGEDGSNSCPWSGCVTDEFVANVKREVTLAKERNCPIIDVTVDYFGHNDDWFGPTDPRIAKRLKGYSKHRSSSKLAFGDGADCILRTCHHKDFCKTKHIRVVGCRTNGCVLAMVKGLRRELPDAEIVVVEDACSDFPQNVNWSEFDQIPNIKRVEASGEAALAA